MTAIGTITGGNLNTGGSVSSTGNVTGGNINTSGLVSASGNVIGGNLRTGGLVSATGNINGANIVASSTITSSTISASGNITGANLNTAGVVTASGTITGGNLYTSGSLTVNVNNAATAIANGGSNAVGNIGTSTNYFNRLFAQATTALYADLAELYSSDADYACGTVVSFGGDAEITLSVLADDRRIAGIVSTNPSYQMNSGLVADYPVAVALQGRVPTKVLGPVCKGDMMVSAGNGHAQACSTPSMGTVLGKALENFNGTHGIIEIVVGRM